MDDKVRLRRAYGGMIVFEFGKRRRRLSKGAQSSDSHLAAAVDTGLNIDPERPLEQRSPQNSILARTTCFT
jgi:hypothetical protein